MSLATTLARPEIVALVPYASARREQLGGDLLLNANESPWNNSGVAGANRYPDCQPSQLRQQYADYAQLTPQQVLISRGADEGIDLLIRTFCRPGQDSISCLTPSYGMYAISAATNAVACNSLPWASQYQLPADLAAQCGNSKLLFVCNPNNPSGSCVNPAQLAALAAQLPQTLLVVDEAYIEFAPERSVANLIDTTPNLVVLRTLSKAFALAGARCGFVLANRDIIAMLEKVIAPYPVPAPVAQLACEATSPDGLALMAQQVAQLNKQKAKFTAAIRSLEGIDKVIDSQANFVLFQCVNSEQVQSALADSGLLIRRYRSANLLGWLRVSIGTDTQMETLLSALRQQLQLQKERL
ncbi:histidinol-phosphate transaminase [uncultured Ferrimonas sp.]|uniref:histidinol-phosphate transaminase n=1 Tax=uncultured Ferrimonas sp. TaxID=432640 RepID=UPI00260932C0|nr:histidinol-phosphate transaminase [uncultured Ferrimonas sp.]